MRKTKKIIIILGIIFVMLVLPKNVKDLQANRTGTVVNNKNANYFFDGIRRMEEAGGGLGQAAVIDGNTYLDSSNNGIDCHMILNTEWGTAGLLGASEYGDLTKLSTINSTTGNPTGVYNMYHIGNKAEMTTGIWTGTGTAGGCSKIAGANGRYKNIYENTNSKLGDGTNAQNITGGEITFISMTNYLFYRGYNSVLGYHSYGVTRQGNASPSASSRAVVVCGADIDKVSE